MYIAPIYVYDIALLLLHSLIFPFSLDKYHGKEIYLCVSQYMQLYLVILVTPKILIIAYGVWITWRLRDIDDEYNESKYIFASVWHFVLAVCGFIAFYFGFGYAIRLSTLCVGGAAVLIFSSFVTLILLFAPKLYSIFVLKVDFATIRASIGAKYNKTSLFGSLNYEKLSINCFMKNASLENLKMEIQKSKQMIFMLREKMDSANHSNLSSIPSPENIVTESYTRKDSFSNLYKQFSPKNFSSFSVISDHKSKHKISSDAVINVISESEE